MVGTGTGAGAAVGLAVGVGRTVGKVDAIFALAEGVAPVLCDGSADGARVVLLVGAAVGTEVLIGFALAITGGSGGRVETGGSNALVGVALGAGVRIVGAVRV